MYGRIIRNTAIAAAFVSGFGGANPAHAETLTDTLIHAYRNSPILEQSRASLRSVDEGVVQARAARLPQLDGTVRGTASWSSQGNSDVTDVYAAELNASLLLFDGGGTDAAIKAAAAAIDASRASLVGVEQDVLLAAITAYVDVRRDQRFVGLARNNVDVITQQLRAAQDRFEVGEVTRTDVSQAQSRLASARSNLAVNRGALESSRQAYFVAVGRQPQNLAPPPALPRLPATSKDAQAIAIREHPDLRQARANIVTAEFDLERARSAKRGTIALTGSVGYDLNTPIDGEDRLRASVGLQGSIPILDGDQNNSLIRQAVSVLDRRNGELQGAARSIRQAVALAWSNLDVARASIRASRQEVRAARIAFEGVQEEAKLGARTTLDVLDAEQSVLNAESNLVAAQRDEYVAAYNLIEAMGLLTVDYLNLGIETYDPEVNLHIVTKSQAVTREGTVLDRISDRWTR